MAAGRRKPTASHSARTQAHAGTRRARLWLLGAVVVTTLIVFAWFPGSSLLSQRASLAATEAELSSLHKQDAALAQEKKSLSDAGEIGRIAREQYQLVSPGQQAYEVLPPSGATSGGSPYTGDPAGRRTTTLKAPAGVRPSRRVTSSQSLPRWLGCPLSSKVHTPTTPAQCAVPALNR